MICDLPMEIIYNICAYAQYDSALNPYVELGMVSKKQHNKFISYKEDFAKYILKWFAGEYLISSECFVEKKIQWKIFMTIKNFYYFLYDKPADFIIKLYKNEYDVFLHISDRPINIISMLITAYEFRWIEIINFLKPIIKKLLIVYYDLLINKLDFMLDPEYFQVDYLQHKRNILSLISELLIIPGDDEQFKKEHNLISDAYTFIATPSIRFLNMHAGVSAVRYS
jgi:hypothetical protein